MILTSIRSIRDENPCALSLDWSAFVQWLEQCSAAIRVSHKEQAPLYGFGDIDRDITKVRSVSGLVFDFDKNPESDWGRLVQWVQSTGYAAVMHRTPSAGQTGYEGQLRARLILPFSRDVTPQEFRVLWGAVRNTFPCPVDESCKNENRFYWPPMNGAPVFTFPGGALDPDPLLTYQPAQAPRPVVTHLAAAREQVSRAQLNQLGLALQRKNSEPMRIAGRALVKAMLGEAFAIKGNRNALIYELTGYIAEKFPFCDAEEVAEHFGPALSLMAGAEPDPHNPAPDVALVVSHLQRHQHRTQAQALDKQAFARALQGAQAAEPQGTPGTSGGGTAPVDATDPTDWPPILQRGSFYWFREHELGPNGLTPIGYSSAYCREDATIEVLRRFEPIGVDLRDDKGRARKFLEIAQDYSEPIEHVVSDLTATTNRYDRSTRTLIQATAKRKKLDPEFDQEVDTWLRVLARDQYEILCDWIATVLHLDRPSAAVYLVGKSGAGKSLFGHCVADLFVEPVTTLDDMTASFNERIQYNPIVFADEQIPERATFAWLREFIQSTTRKINEKFKPLVICKGAPRLIIGANPEHDFFRAQSISRDALEAVVKRFIRIETTNEARDYLLGVNARSFYLEHRFARHALYLHATRKVEHGSRFAVEGQAVELIQELRTHGQALVAEVLLEYLLNPSRIDVRGDYGLMIKSRRLYVTAQGIINAAKFLWNQPRFRNTQEVGQVLALMGLERSSIRPPKGASRYYHEIDMKQLHNLGVEYGYDLETIAVNLQRNTPEAAMPNNVSPLRAAK